MNVTDVDARAAALEHANHAAEAVRLAVDARNTAILLAVTLGAGVREVARATGLSHTGVARIVERTEVPA